MDWYALVKFLHVASAVVWVGGGFTLMLMAVRADRASDIDGTLQVMRATADLGNRLFMPASMLTLLFGLIMCWFWVGFTDLWIVVGLAGFAVSALIGSLIFKPTADRMTALIAEQGVTPAALAEGRKIMKIARFDYAVMFVVIALMVLKPTADDALVLGALCLMLLVGAVAAFGGRSPAEAEA